MKIESCQNQEESDKSEIETVHIDQLHGSHPQDIEKDDDKMHTGYEFLNAVEDSDFISGIEIPQTEQCQQMWGTHTSKPQAQLKWEEDVARAADKIADYHPFQLEPPDDVMWAEAVKWRDGYQSRDIRPHKSKIQTFGKEKITLRFGRKTYSFIAIIADINQLVIGWDFCKEYLLTIVWTEMQDLELWDRRADTRSPLQMTPNVTGEWPNLKGYVEPEDKPDHVISAAEIAEATRTFQEWSQKQTVEALAKEGSQPIPPEYKRLMDKYPGILSCDFKATEVKHGVQHHIDTGDNKPCQAKVQLLMPGSTKEVQGKKDWMELDRLWVIKRVDPQDVNVWSSALHLAPKCEGSLRVCGDFRALNDKTMLDM